MWMVRFSGHSLQNLSFTSSWKYHFFFKKKENWVNILSQVEPAAGTLPLLRLSCYNIVPPQDRKEKEGKGSGLSQTLVVAWICAFWVWGMLAVLHSGSFHPGCVGSFPSSLWQTQCFTCRVTLRVLVLLRVAFPLCLNCLGHCCNDFSFVF